MEHWTCETELIAVLFWPNKHDLAPRKKWEQSKNKNKQTVQNAHKQPNGEKGVSKSDIILGVTPMPGAVRLSKEHSSINV